MSEATATFYDYSDSSYREVGRSQMPRAILQHYSFASLSVQQQALLKVLRKDISQLNGRAVKFICDSQGIPFVVTGQSGVRGSIVKVTGDPAVVESLRFMIHLPGDAMYNAILYEFELVTSIKPPTKKELDKKEKDRKIKVLDDLLSLFNRKVNKGYDTLQQSLIEGERGLKDTEKILKELDLRHKQYSKQIKDAKEKIEKGNFKNITLDEMMLSLQEIYKNKSIDRVYVSTENALIIVTKMLHANDNNSSMVGRFVFKIELVPVTNRENILATNLDFVYNQHAHPNIDNGFHICWGSNARVVSQMYNQNHLYQLVDFMVAFFTTFPHEEGSPYVNYDTWLNNRGQRDNSNTSLLGTILMEIPQPSKRLKDMTKSFLAQMDGRKVRVTQSSSQMHQWQQSYEQLRQQREQVLRNNPTINPYPGRNYPPMPTVEEFIE